MDSKERVRILREKAGWDNEEAKGIWAIDSYVNVLVDATKGLQYIREIKDTIIQAFRLNVSEGPLAREPIRASRCCSSTQMSTRTRHTGDLVR